MGSADRSLNVLVLDMQPIDPPIGGGRLRLLGLYHALGPGMDTTYIGTYDWPGERYRDHRLSFSLREINIPLSPLHFSACDYWRKQIKGKTIIDAAFAQLAHLSPEYINRVHEEVRKAHIVFFSHPWIYPLVQDLIEHQNQIVIYDSHNVEGLLRAAILDDDHLGSLIVSEVVRIESHLCYAADLVLACSHEDRELFHKLYRVPYRKIKVVPNGVFAKQIVPADPAEKEKLKQLMGLQHDRAAIFVGSLYQPNVEAVRYIVQELASKCPDVGFIICGSVCDEFSSKDLHAANIGNVYLAGVVSEKQKIRYLQASDIALNPMSSGSGTNIKMFDYFAAGLPTITTPVGARGIQETLDKPFICVPLDQFNQAIQELLWNQERQQELAEQARHFVQEKYAWERISPALGRLSRLAYQKKAKKPFFSVIVPTYNRHDKLAILINRLAAQKFRSFEAIVVDQSSSPWPERNKDHGFDLTYIHTDIKGAVKARNMACFYALGEVLAFVDDDCEPQNDWLLNARPYFDDPSVVGIEGLIRCPTIDSPEYRTVSNENFRGFGFMTANLFLRLETFNAVNGFDERFDNPHFREDTDLAWRALEFGQIPFGEDVVVLHPPHRRSIKRESVEERNKFFVKDALLMKKHPERYKELFHAERHWKKTEGFCEHLVQGAARYGIELPEWCTSLLEAQKLRDAPS